MNKELNKLPAGVLISAFSRSIGNLCVMEPTNQCKPCSLPHHSSAAKDLGTKSFGKFNCSAFRVYQLHKKRCNASLSVLDLSFGQLQTHSREEKDGCNSVTTPNKALNINNRRERERESQRLFSVSLYNSEGRSLSCSVAAERQNISQLGSQILSCWSGSAKTGAITALAR